MLKETEWMTINHILLELYTINDIHALAEKTMKVLRMLIPYSKGYFIMLDEEQNVLPDTMYFMGFDDMAVNSYLTRYYDADYLRYLYEITEETTVYQDTEILTDEIRRQTPFYRRFLQPQDIPYGCGILVIRNKSIIGIFNLFRSEQLGDFSEKDIYILNILKKHIENMIFNSRQMNRRQLMAEKCCEQMEADYGLTQRECDILRLISDGCSNNEICDKLVISLSTVKKHVYNIFVKTQVRSRSQLLNLLYHNDFPGKDTA